MIADRVCLVREVGVNPGEIRSAAEIVRISVAMRAEKVKEIRILIERTADQKVVPSVVREPQLHLIPIR